MIKILKYLKPYIHLTILAIIALSMQAMFELYLPNLMSDMVNEGMLKGNTGYITSVGGKMLIVALLSSICAILTGFLSAKIALGVSTDLRRDIFTKVESFSPGEFGKIPTSSLITRTTNDIVQIQQVFFMAFRFLIYSPIIAIGGVFMAYNKSAKLTVILLVALPLLMVFVITISRIVLPKFKLLQKKLDNLNRIVRENLTGIRVIRAFDKQKTESKRFRQANVELTDLAISLNRTMAVMQPVMMLFMNLITLAIVWFAGIRIGNGEMHIGDMMAFMQYAMQIMFSLIMVTMMFIMIPRAQASASRVNEVLEIENIVKDHNENPRIDNNKRGYLRFENVTFQYSGAEKPILEDISFEAKPGEITAIIGSTGCGKSTLLNLIPRFYNVTKGEIYIDDVSISSYSQEELRKKIGYVPQSPVLFSGSIFENIRYGKEDANEEEVIKAANIAQAHDFIMEMNKGYSSNITQGGSNVSGGQKQRLSIARALVRKPEVYLFDDSFSALDYGTDSKLRAALIDEINDSTALMVAQRITTVRNAHRIIVLEKGKIAGMGTHDELMKDNEIYRQIALSQLSEEEAS